MTYITDPRYGDADQSIIIATVNGKRSRIPAVRGNADFEALIADGVLIAPFVPPAPTAVDVRAECARRMRLAFRARDDVHLAQIIANGVADATELSDLRQARMVAQLNGDPNPPPDWTPGQAAEAAYLQSAKKLKDAFRAASNAMETSPPIDYADDKYWPELP